MSEPTSTLLRSAYERLRADVQAAHWEPGRKLLMHELRDRYLIGATPIREALSRLSSESWVVHSEQRGYSVAEASAERLRDLVATRIAVESVALDQAFARRQPAWEEGVLVAFHRLSREARSSSQATFVENPSWERLHRDFHTALLRGCGSPMLLSFCEHMYDQSYRYRVLAARAGYKRRHDLDEHKAICDAVLDDDLERARTLLAEHYRSTADLFVKTCVAPAATGERN